MLALAAAYVLFGGVSWVDGLLFGLQAAVVAVVIEAVVRIGKRTLRSPALLGIAALSFVAITFAHVPFPAVVAATALIGWLLGRRHPHLFPLGRRVTADAAHEPATLLSDTEEVPPAAARSALRAAAICAVLWALPVVVLVLTLGTENIFTQQALLFSKSALVTFGGAYAVLGYITQEAVNRYGWISTSDMITGLGLAETTPGPLIMVVQFVAFLAAYNHPGVLPPLLAGTLGAILAVWVTFVPCFLFIFLGAPFVERLRHNQSISHALTAVGAAIAGVVLNLALWFALHTAFGTVTETRIGPFTLPVPEPGTVQIASVAISALAAVLIFGFHSGTLRVLGVCAAIGAALALTGLAA
jgi:chromate transporter